MLMLTKFRVMLSGQMVFQELHVDSAQGTPRLVLLTCSVPEGFAVQEDFGNILNEFVVGFIVTRLDIGFDPGQVNMLFHHILVVGGLRSTINCHSSFNNDPKTTYIFRQRIFQEWPRRLVADQFSDDFGALGRVEIAIFFVEPV